MNIIRIAALGLFIAASQAAPAGAADCIWTGAGIDANWNTIQNWTGCNGGRPQSGDVVIFSGGAARPQNVNNIAGLAVNEIRITGNGSGNVPFRTDGVRIVVRVSVSSNAPANASGSGPRIAAPIAFGGNGAVANLNSAGGTLTLDRIDLGGFGLIINTVKPISIGGIDGTGSVLKQGASSVGLGNGSYSGATVIQTGGVIAFGGNALGSSGDGNATLISDGGYLLLFNGITISEQFILGGNGPELLGLLRVGGTGATATLAGPILVNSHSTIGAHDGAQLNITSAITTGSPDIVVQTTGSGTVSLGNPGNAWGSLVINNKRLTLAANGVLPDTAPVTLVGDATLDLNGHDEVIGTLGASVALAGIQLGSGTLTVNQLAEGTYNGTIDGVGRLIKAGPARLTLAGTNGNTYSGLTTVQAGELRLAKSGRIRAMGGSVVVNGGRLVNATRAMIPAAASVTINSPGEWELFDLESVAALSGNGNVHFRTVPTGLAGGLTVGATNASMTFSGAIDGATTLPMLKAGTGTLTLNGASTFTGGLQITGGEVAVNGSLGPVSPVLVDGGRLSGTGRVGNIIGSGGATVGAVSPGTSPGILSGTTAVIGGPFIVELNGTTAGSDYDQLRLTGGLTLRAGAELRVTKSFTPRKGAQFTIVAAGQAAIGTFAGLAQGADLTIDGQRFRIDYLGGNGHDIVLTAQDGPTEMTWFLAEGATGPFFDEDVLIANPGTQPAPTTLTFFKDNGEQVVVSRTLAPQSQTVVHVDEIPGLEATAASVQVTSTSGAELFVERSMFWGPTSYAGHTGSALSTPSADWFFAEGAQGFFDTFILIVNPNAAPADVTFTFLRENEAPVVKTVPVGARSRLTVGTGEFAELKSRSFGIQVHATQPIMAERAMYFASLPGRLWGGGHESAGVTALSKQWYLAEGATGDFFDTFILLSNPQTTEAQVTMKFLLATGETIAVRKTVPASGRLTVSPEAEEDPRLKNTTVSTVVDADVPIVAERSMYWRGATLPWGESHNSFGIVAPSVGWGLAEGRVGGTRAPFSTYILLANPQATAAEVEVTFLRDNGAPVVRTYTVPATGRYTIDASSVEELRDATFGTIIRVANNVPIVVERSMYWDANGIFWSGGTNATGIRRVP